MVIKFTFPYEGIKMEAEVSYMSDDNFDLSVEELRPANKKIAADLEAFMDIHDERIEAAAEEYFRNNSVYTRKEVE